jgi:hypothetical protein
MSISIVCCTGAFGHDMFASLEQSNVACNDPSQKSIVFSIAGGRTLSLFSRMTVLLCLSIAQYTPGLEFGFIRQ